MWPFWKQTHEVVSVSLKPQQLSCAVFDFVKNNKKMRLCSYASYPFEWLEFEKSILFNPTKVKQRLDLFLQNNNITNPFIALSISGPQVSEKVVTVSMASPEQKDFNIAEDQSHLQWQFCYLGPSLESGFDFYLCGVSQEMLFQYKLLSVAAGIPFVLVTTSKAACLELYKYIRGVQFRQGQLAVDLQKHRYDFEQLCTPDILKKKIVMPVKTHGTYSDIATHAGLFLLGNKL